MEWNTNLKQMLESSPLLVVLSRNCRVAHPGSAHAWGKLLVDAKNHGPAPDALALARSEKLLGNR